MYKYLVRDRHTNTIQGTYKTERSAMYAAARMGEKEGQPNRYKGEAR